MKRCNKQIDGDIIEERVTTMLLQSKKEEIIQSDFKIKDAPDLHK
jgi:hypothetical protein